MIGKTNVQSTVTEKTVSEWGFTKNTGTVTGVKMNGTTKSPSSGVVDLGTVITAHQDISGKVDKVSGKGLSTEDFTTLLKQKLDGLSNYDDTDITNSLDSLRSDFDKLVSGDTTTAIKTFNEIIAFLDGISDTQDLSGIIASIEQQIAGKMDKVTLAKVATSGSYNDLTNKPAIPSAVTESTVSGWGFTKNTGTYSMPSAGIPKIDLASAVQASLDKADTALQSYTEQYKGTVTGIKVNGTTNTPNSSGIVDLGEISGGGGGGNAGGVVAELMVEVTYDELVSMRDKSELVPGMKYRMIDYETMTSAAGTQSGGHPFDLILTALDVDTLDEKCSAVQSDRDTEGYFSGSNLASWQILYCLDNDKTKFHWAAVSGKEIMLDYTEIGFGEIWFTYDGMIEVDGVTCASWLTMLDGVTMYAVTLSETPSVGDSLSFYFPDDNSIMDSDDVVGGVRMSTVNGKGVIYRLVDEKRNDVNYDFKNILFARKLTDGLLDVENGTDTYVYTFSQMTEDGLCLDMSLSSACFLNSISNGSVLGDNVFINQPLGTCCLNTLNECSKNTFGDMANNNYFGYNCYSNVFGEYCRSNHFVGYCSNNTFGAFLINNTFKEFCSGNVIGEKCIGNTFGSDFEDNQIGDGFSYNTIGNTCRGVNIPNVESSSGTLFSKNIIGNDLWFVNIIVDPEYSGYAEYYNFSSGINGGINSPLEIHIKRGRRYETKVAMNSQGEVKIYCEADLVE